MEEAQTDTTVVPQGVVAAMKALREKQRAAQGKYFLPSCLLYIYALGYSVNVSGRS